MSQSITSRISMSAAMNEYIVSDKKVESQSVISFCLKLAKGNCPPYIPGAYLVFDLPVGEGGEMIKREYSISNWSKTEMRVSIKRENAPMGRSGVADGLVSTYFHDEVKVGDKINAYGPAGKFLLNLNSQRPVVLLSGGIGQTPLVSMALALFEKGSRDTYFFHACENGEMHSMRDEIASLVENSPLIRSHTCYANPLPTDILGEDYDNEGFINKKILQDKLPLNDYEFYLCGPSPFMQSMFDLLLSLGVTEDKINYEFFGPATLLKPGAINPKAVVASAVDAKITEQDTSQPLVTFAKSGIQVRWDPEIENLLEFAEEQELMPDFSCRAGTCDSCKIILKSGDIEYKNEPLERPEEGSILLCCSIPTSDVVIDL